MNEKLLAFIGLCFLALGWICFGSQIVAFITNLSAQILSALATI